MANEPALRAIPEVCITHGTPLILCDQCVAENAMRLRRRLSLRISQLFGHRRVPEANELLAAIEAELDKELPG